MAAVRLEEGTMNKTYPWKIADNRLRQVGIPLLAILVSVLAVWYAQPPAGSAVAASGPSPTPTDSQSPISTFTPTPSATVTGIATIMNTLTITPTTYFEYVPLNSRKTWPQSVFGVELGYIGPGSYLNLVTDAETYWLRYNGLLWSDIQPTQGGGLQWANAASLEAQLIEARKANLQTILVVRSTPSWAQLVPGFECGAMKSQYFDDFGSFMAQAVARYSGPPYYVRHFEIWNEPDVDPNIISSPTDPYGCWGDNSDPYYGGGYYGQMLKVVYPMIKAVAPNVQVLTGGLLMHCDPRIDPVGCKPSKFLEGILLAGAKNAFDIVGFHGYDYYNPSFDTFGNPGWASGKFNNEPSGVLRPVFISKLGYIKGLLNAFGIPQKPVFNTEGALICGGALDPPGGPGCEANDTSPYELLKADYVAQLFASALGEKLLGNIYFSVRGWRNSGLAYTGGAPRPAYFAYEFSQSMLWNGVPVRKVTEYSKVTGYEFNRSEGNSLWVVWATDGGTKNITLPFTPAAIWDVFGDPVAVTGTSVTLSVSPYYIEKP
jgi:hypothetical protein